MNIKEMKLGETYIDSFMVYERKQLKTRNDKDYLVFQLGDCSGSLYCKVWTAIEDYPYKEGQIIKAEVEIIQWNNTNEFSLKRHRLVTEEEKSKLNHEKFLKSITKDEEKLYLDFIKSEIIKVENENFKNLLNSFFEDKEILNSFIKCPAAVSHHENYIGGLIKHTYYVLKNCISICQNYERVNKDLLVTSAILHDIGKIKNYSYDSNIKVTREGTFIEHISLGAMIVSERINKIKDFNQLNREKLLSAILSSHGKYEWGSPILPRTIEATILHFCDLFDSRISYFYKEIDQSKDTNFVYSKPLETYIYVNKL
jgi:3'-5' exoribonuclease